MNSLNTLYLGLQLKNPIVVSSSGLTSNLEGIRRIQNNGAGALVLKSLFEEQILHETKSLAVSSDYPEAMDYLVGYVSSNTVERYLELIASAKREVDIPVIASVNCFSASQWIDYAQQIQAAGADALEVNVFQLPNNVSQGAEHYEALYLTLAEKLSKKVSIPLSFKLGSHFTNPLNIIQQLWNRRVKGVVLFNRFYAPDIDIDEMRISASDVFSQPSDIRSTLRWVGMVSHMLPHVSTASSTGVHTGEGVVKMLLAGASAVQVCSVLYQKGPEYIKVMLEFLSHWMDKKGYSTIDDFRGMLNYGGVGDPTVYERSQFMKYYSSHEEH